MKRLAGLGLVSMFFVCAVCAQNINQSNEAKITAASTASAAAIDTSSDSFLRPTVASAANADQATRAAGAGSHLEQDLQDYIAEQMKLFHVPGMGLVVVRDNQVLLSRGYGYRDLDAKLPVTTKTLFGIGSITKSFTCSILTMLAEQGKLDWDHPVRDYLPDFQLMDPVASSHATPRDLVTHRTGLSRHDALWYNSSLTREQLFERLRYLPPSKDFRSAWQYNNLLIMTAGMIAEKITGERWEQLVREDIFGPLGMSGTNTSVLDSEKSSDYAHIYSTHNDEFVPLHFRNIDALGPAGSINSNIEDMQKYLLMHMKGGRVGDKQIMAAEQSKQMQTPQMVMPDEPSFPEEGFISYGMTLFITTYRGHRVVYHTGHIDGYSALMSFMPLEKIGMVMLINVDQSRDFPSALERNIYDRLLGLDQINWSQRFRDKAAEARVKADAAKAKRDQEHFPETQPTHSLSAYVGEYRDPGYGALTISQDANGLQLNYNNMTAPLAHHRYDAFEVAKTEAPRSPFQGLSARFDLDVAGDIVSVAVPFESTVDPIVFVKVKDKDGKATPNRAGTD